MVLNGGWGELPSDPEAPVHLQGLKYLTITPYSTEMPITMPQLLPFLKLKSIVAFRMEFLKIDEWPEIDINVLSIEDLELSCSWLSPAPFLRLLQCFSNLERLSYDHDGFMAEENPLQPALAGRALAHLKHSLRELILIDEYPVNQALVDNLFSRAFIGNGDVGPIGSLADYSKLEILDTMYHALVVPYYEEEDGSRYANCQNLVDALPRSIRYLTVRLCPEDFVSHIHELFDKVEEFPHLKRFTAVFDREGPEVKISKSTMRKFRAKSVKYGISFELQYRVDDSDS